VAESEVLQRVMLFANLAPAELAELAGHLRRRRYARGEVLCLQGDPGTSLYIIESGRVKLGVTSPEGREVLLNIIEPGQIFGEMTLLDGKARSADATAFSHAPAGGGSTYQFISA
jgi:CRP-like cAMP-binding protein